MSIERRYYDSDGADAPSVGRRGSSIAHSADASRMHSKDAIPAIETKFLIPGQSSTLVARPGLIERLDEGIRGRLTLLSAPAGSGKSSLIASWVRKHHAPGPVAWFGLDSGDNDRRRFWTNVLVALSRVDETVALSALEAPLRGSIDRFLPRFMNALSQMTEPMVLVLDDLHEVIHPPIIRDLKLLVRRAPDPLRLVISTRVDPDLDLDRLRLEGRCTEIRAAELAFTLDETRELLTSLDISVSEEDIRLLQTKTEGWIAGVQLAATSLKSRPDAHQFIHELVGEEVPISDYLVKEVLAGQPEGVRDFLLRTSVVKVINADLANALTNSVNGAALLLGLERGNALVTVLEEDQRWYRYHPLFRELLLAELHFEFPRELGGLYRRAAEWFHRHGYVLNALEHSVAGKDWNRFGDLLRGRWISLLLEGDMRPLRTLTSEVPADVIETDPELAVACAVAHLDAGDLAKAERFLRVARSVAAAVNIQDSRLTLALAAADLYSSRLRGNRSETTRAARELMASPLLAAADETLEEGDLRALALSNLGIAEFWTGDFDDAEAHLRGALALADANGREYLDLVCNAYLALVRLAQGRLEAAAARAAKALDGAERHGWVETPSMAVALCVLSVVHYLWNDLETAESEVARTNQMARSVRDRPLRALIRLIHGDVLHATGSSERALDLFTAAQEELGDWPALESFGAMVRGLQAQARAAAGEPEKALADLEQAMDASPSRELAEGLVRLQLAAGDPSGALATLRTAAAASSVGPDLPIVTIDLRVLESLAREQSGDPVTAERSLEDALDLAEPDGYRRLITEHGGPIRAMLERLLRRGTAHRAFVEELLEDLTKEREAGQKSGRLIEPLTSREIAVLRYLPTLMSYEEIAAEMFISVNTLKTHIKGIYRKLSVNRRRDAVYRAQQLRLIEANRDLAANN